MLPPFFLSEFLKACVYSFVMETRAVVSFPSVSAGALKRCALYAGKDRRREGGIKEGFRGFGAEREILCACAGKCSWLKLSTSHFAIFNGHQICFLKWSYGKDLLDICLVCLLSELVINE